MVEPNQREIAEALQLTLIGPPPHPCLATPHDAAALTTSADTPSWISGVVIGPIWVWFAAQRHGVVFDTLKIQRMP
ncbi:MAG: hypothetical protein JWL70_582 [Acidimicrobiia bacterium]|nr:hypothetical protein [Acidimicrobiia bacterium]